MPNHSHDDENKAREEVESFISGYKTMEILYHYAITKDGILIGHVGIGETKDDSISVYEICCGINKNHRGFGYAAEASKAFACYYQPNMEVSQPVVADRIKRRGRTSSVPCVFIYRGYFAIDLKISDFTHRAG
jgi:hypothetical protein